VAAGAQLVGLAAAPAAAVVSCGATITADTTLSSADPVTTGPCASHGIAVGADNITLDCGGRTIKGNQAGKGIRVLAGNEGATIQNCVVDGFATGIELGGAGWAVVSNVVSQNNKNNGIETESDFNGLSDVLSRKNGAHGFKLAGLGNSAENAIALGNTGAGFRLAGRALDVSASLAVDNGAQGYLGTGVDESIFSGLTAIGNTGDGVAIAGGTVARPNSFSDIRAIANGGNGILIPGTNPDASVDDGGNVGFVNSGPTQCQIAGAACQP
jgi:hypothetical protein